MRLNRLQGATIAPIAVPMSLGVNEFGAELGPFALDSGLRRRVAARGGASRLRSLSSTPVAPSLAPPLFGNPVLKNRDPILATCEALAAAVGTALRAGDLALVLGGDHALSIGSIAGAAASCERLGILWIDTHADLNTAETTPSGNIHGMPMALALGHGDPGLRDIGGRVPHARASDVVMIGLRDLDPGEALFLACHDVTAYPMADLDRHGGFSAVVTSAVAQLMSRHVDAVHVSFDLDVLDPSCFTATNTPSPGGLIVREALAGLRVLRASELPIRSVDWVELNPMLDTRGASTDVAIRLLGELLGEW